MEAKTEPFEIVDVLTSRQIDLVQDGVWRGRIRWTLGQPEVAEVERWLCLFNLSNAEEQVLAQGCSEGTDALQAILRATELSRAMLIHMCSPDGFQARWGEAEWAGLPEFSGS